MTSNLIIQFVNPKVFDLCIFWEKKYKPLKKIGYFSRFNIAFPLNFWDLFLSLISRFYSDVQVLLILSRTWIILETASPIGPGSFSLVILMYFPWGFSAVSQWNSCQSDVGSPYLILCVYVCPVVSDSLPLHGP